MRVLIADDSLLVREGLAQLLRSAGLDVLAAVADAESLLREVVVSHPDAVIVDIRMPPTHTDEGIEAAQRIRREHPDTGVLVLSQYLESDYAMRLLNHAPVGVGYLLKERVSEIGVVLDALRRIADGDCVVDPTIVSRLMRRPRNQDVLSRLTPREQQVLSLIAEGRSNAAIAQSLTVSGKTIEANIRQILQKLDVHATPADNRRVLAVLRYLAQPGEMRTSGGRVG